MYAIMMHRCHCRTSAPNPILQMHLMMGWVLVQETVQ
eukprot:COSAG02_NODE_16036_length_1119_cov_1.093137_2_plen_36_part_01